MPRAEKGATRHWTLRPTGITGRSTGYFLTTQGGAISKMMNARG